MPYSVYVTGPIPDAGLDLLRQHCATVEVYPSEVALPRAQLLEAVRGRDGVLCLLHDRIDAELMDATAAVGFANYAVGYNNLDLAAACSSRTRPGC